jgi:hypothetical protein
MRALFKLFVAQASLLTVMLGIFVLRGSEPGPLNYDDPLMLPVKLVRDQSSDLFQTAQQKFLNTSVGHELANYLAKTDQALEPLLTQAKAYLENLYQDNSQEVESAPTVVIDSVEPTSVQVVTRVVSIEADQSDLSNNSEALESVTSLGNFDEKIEEESHEKVSEKANQQIFEEVVQLEPIDQKTEQSVKQIEKPLVTIIQTASTPISPNEESSTNLVEVRTEPSVQPTLFGSTINDTTDLIERAFTSTVVKTQLAKGEQVDEVARMEDLFGEDFVPQNVTAPIVVNITEQREVEQAPTQEAAEPKVNLQPNLVVEAETPQPALLKVKKTKEEKPKIVLKKLEPSLTSEKRTLAEVYATSMNQKQVDDVKQEPGQLIEKVGQAKKAEPKVKQQPKPAIVATTENTSVVKTTQQPAPKSIIKADPKPPVNATIVKLKPARALVNPSESVATTEAKPELKKLIKITDSDAGPVIKYGFKIDEPTIEVDTKTDIPESVFSIEPIPTF